MDQEEKNRKRKAWITSGGIQVALLLLFYFLVAWQAPNPPNPEFGIELNFGLVETGSGNQLVASPISPETVEEEQVAKEQTTQEIADNQENIETQDPVETQESSSQQTENNDEIDQKNVSKASEQEVEDTNLSQGNTDDTGDQGDPEGDLNEEALYGNSGGGDDGSSLQMSGWEWDSPPEPYDTTEETGKIVYEIEVDSEGYLTGYEVINSTVSPSVVTRYTLAIQELTFSKTSFYKPAQTSKGRITFIIRAR